MESLAHIIKKNATVKNLCNLQKDRPKIVLYAQIHLKRHGKDHC